MATKTDNHNPRAKLELRRYFLRRYHADAPPHVLDCCQGSGLLWRQLRAEFPLASYWGVDVKRKAGRLKLDSARILAQPGWPQDVIDVDTYGSPWKHFDGVLRHLTRPTTVFLTIGQLTIGGGNADRRALAAMGLVFRRLKLPNSLGVRVIKTALSYCLTVGCSKYIILHEAVEAVSTGSARYVGVRLIPAPK